jgi:hypothetical protein
MRASPFLHDSIVRFNSAHFRIPEVNQQPRLLYFAIWGQRYFMTEWGIGAWRFLETDSF